MESMNHRHVWRVLLIGLLVIVITILHYRTDQLQLASHIIFRELYFLPIVRKVIEAHDGSRGVRNYPDKGVTFQVVLPLHGPCDRAEQ